MKKIEWIEFVKARLDIIDPTNRFHERYIEMGITIVRNEMIIKSFRSQWKDMGLYIKEFTEIAISTDALTGKDYSVIPISQVNIPDEKGGIRSISTMQGVGVEFVKMNSNEIPISYDLDVNIIDDVIGYRQINNRIEYVNLLDTITEVKMEIVVPFDAYDDLDEVYIPSEVNGMDSITIITQYLQGTPLQTLLNNNSNKES